MDVNLRELLDVAAGEPPRRVTAEAVRRAARRRAAKALAVGLALVLGAGLTATLAAGAITRGTAPSSGGHAHAAPPRYYVGSFVDRKRPQAVLAVRSRATGAVTAVIRNPLPRTSCGGGNVGLAAAAGQRYFMICVMWTRHGTSVAVATRVYRFQVTKSGRVAGFSLVRGGVLKGLWAFNIAASPDGSQVALQVFRPSASGTLSTAAIPVGILVINARTGQHALWRSGPYAPGTVQFTSATDISFTRDGRDLVVLEMRCHRSRTLSNCNGHADVQVRAFSPAAAGGSLNHGRVLLRQSQLAPPSTSISGAFSTADG